MHNVDLSINDKINELLDLNGKPFTQDEAKRIIEKLLKENISSSLILKEIQTEIEDERQAAALLKDKLNLLAKLPRYLAEIMLNESYSTEQIYYVVAILTEINTNGFIRDFSVSNIIKVLQEKFDFEFEKRSTMYQVHNTIMRKGTTLKGKFSISKKPLKSNKVKISRSLNKHRYNFAIQFGGTPIFKIEDDILNILDYTKAFAVKNNNGGTVILPTFFFTKEFRNISITALRMAIYYLIRITDTSNLKIINFRADNLIQAANLKKRSKSDLHKYYDELEPYFDIRQQFGTFQAYTCSLRATWFVTKDVKAQLKGTVQSCNVIYSKKAQYILSILKNKGILSLLKDREVKYAGDDDYQETKTKEAFNSLVELLHKIDSSKIITIIMELGKKLKDLNDPVRSIGAFVRELINKYVKGFTETLKNIKWYRAYFKFLRTEKGFNIKRDFPDMADDFKALMKRYCIECNLNINFQRNKELLRQKYGVT